MTPNEVLLFQCLNSRQTAGANGLCYPQCAHGSFELSEDGSETFTRVSIKVS